MRVYIIFLCFFTINTLDVNSQIVNPKVWLFGYTGFQADTISLDTGIYTKFGINVIDFRNNQFNLSRLPKGLGSLGCNSFIYDKYDSLILYSNGSKIFNGKHRLIEGGDSLCYGLDWKTSIYSGCYYGMYIITRYNEAITLIPSVSNTNQYYLFSPFVTRDSIKHYKLVYSLVDMSLNNGLGKVIEKEKVIKYGDFTEAIASCKHSNGRDWWIITREYNKKQFTILLLDSTGIKIHSESQSSQWDLPLKNAFKGNFSNRFSWDGKLLASYTYEGLELFDFDRCKGILSNRREYVIPTDDTSSCSYVCFSPNNKLVYALLGHKIYQIEIATNIRRKIADWDYREDTMEGGTASFYTSFGFPQLAPNGKIYISTSEGTRYLHVIDKPNEIGSLCNFKQRYIKLLNWNASLPMFPNYELGADTSCHGSSIDEPKRYKIDIYPNPASSRIHIEGTSHETVIYNTLGQQVLVSREKDIDVSHLPVGVYHVLLSDRNGAVLKREKLIVQR